MKRLLPIGLVIAGCLSSGVAVDGQGLWQPINVPINYLQINQILADTVEDALYVCGSHYPSAIPLGGDSGNVICKWTNEQWDTLGTFQGSAIHTMIRWGDTLIVAGTFISVNHQPITGIAAWYGSGWHPFGEVGTSGPYRFKIVDDELYAVGGNEYMDGHFCNGLARRSGGEWVNVGTLELLAFGGVTDITTYNGQLVICGAINGIGQQDRSILGFNGSTWEPVMQPMILGNLCGAVAMIEYQGDLIVTGAIDVNAGNTGHNIQRWDGQQWHPMGTGLTIAPNNYQWIEGGKELWVRDGLLYVCGGFYYAGGVHCNGVATWNGQEWCGLGDDLNPTVYSIAWYHDTLYAASNVFVNGVDVNGVARFIGTGTDTCSGPLSIADIPIGTQMQIWPDPSSDIIHLRTEGLRMVPGSMIQLYNAFGQLARTDHLRPDGILDVTSLTDGVYTVRVTHPGGRPISYGRFVCHGAQY